MKSDNPIHPDRLATLGNHAVGELPAKVRADAERTTRTFSILGGGALGRAPSRLGTSARGSLIHLDLPRGLVEGIVNPKIQLIKPTRASARELGPDLPKWAGLLYHPQAALPLRHRRLRRKSGGWVEPNVVVGNDDRQTYYPSGYPWHCIGRLDVWNDASASSPAWSGTGALVGRNVVITAAHVVPWNAKSWKARFTAAYYDGQSIYGSGMESWVTLARGYANTSNVVGWDMATLQLEKKLGDSLGYFGAKSYSPSWNDEPYWTHCGYAGAVSGVRPNWQNGITVTDTDSDAPGLEVEHDGDVTAGDSGGPLFAWWEKGPYVVGTHSGQEQEYHFPFSFPWVNVDAGGGGFVDLIRFARDNW